MLPVQLLLGKALLQNGEVAAAEVALLEALKLGVNRSEVVPLLGQAYLAQGKHKMLFEQHHFCMTGLPPPVQQQVLLLQASAYGDMGNSREALQTITDARAINSRIADVWLAEVPIRIRTRQYREAQLAVDRAKETSPETMDVWYQQASISHASGKLGDALAAYDRVLKIDPHHVEARIARAGILLDQKQYPLVAQDLDELARVASKEPRAAYMRALLAELDDNKEGVRKSLRQVTEFLDPVPVDFIRYRPQLLMLNGLAHFSLGEIEKAQGYLESFQRLQTNTPVAKLLAQIYLSQSRADRAVEVLETYLKAQPNDGQALVLVGSALMAKGQNARAMSYMKLALQAHDAPEFRTVLGLSMIRSGQLTNAIPELEAALKQGPVQTQAAASLVGLYLRTGQTGKAVSLAEKLVKQQPTDAEFLNLLGVTKLKVGKRADARAAFEDATRRDDKLIAPRMNLARMDIADSAYDTAIERLGSILKDEEKNPEAMQEMAVVSERRGLLPDAQRWLEKSVDSASLKEPRWPLALAEFHLRHGRPGPALEAARTASSRAPEDLLVLLTMARVQLANNDAVSAKSSLTTATRIAEYNAPALVQIALLQLSANNPAGAAYSLEKALSSDSAYMPAQALMAETELRLGEPVKAEKRARSLVEKYPKKGIGYTLAGDIAMSRGLLSDAQEAYRRAHQVEPSTDTVIKLFRSLVGQDAKSALQVAEQWLKSNPKDAAVLRALADGQSYVGNLAAARKSYENLLKLTPEDGAAMNNLANVLYKLKDPGAARMAESAFAKNPGNPYVIDTLGWILFKNGEVDRALLLLRDARLRAPENNVIRFHLGAVLAKAGRPEEARDELRAALKGNPNFDGVEEARNILVTLK